MDINRGMTANVGTSFHRNLAKPATEGKQFIPPAKATFESILFGEAMRLRRLHQRNKDYLISLNHLFYDALCPRVD